MQRTGCEHAFAHACEGHRKLEILFLSGHLSWLLRWVFSLNLELTNKLAWRTSEPQRLACFYLPSTGIKSACLWLLKYVPGIELRSFSPSSKHSSTGWSLQSPQLYFFALSSFRVYWWVTRHQAQLDFTFIAIPGHRYYYEACFYRRGSWTLA